MVYHLFMNVNKFMNILHIWTKIVFEFCVVLDEQSDKGLHALFFT